MPQLIRALIVLLSAVAVLTLLFVAWWLALAFVLVMLVVTQFRRLVGGRRPSPPASGPSSGGRGEREPLVIEGSFVRETDAGAATSGAGGARRPPLDHES